MNEPLYPADVEAMLLRLMGLLEKTVEEFAEISELRAEAEAEYKNQYHRMMIKMVDGTVSQKESMAQVRSSDAFREWKLLEAQEKGHQQRLISIRTQIESLRTISANVRAAIGG